MAKAEIRKYWLSRYTYINLQIPQHAQLLKVVQQDECLQVFFEIPETVLGRAALKIGQDIPTNTWTFVPVDTGQEYEFDEPYFYVDTIVFDKEEEVHIFARIHD